jgi:hypothetical protein
VIYVPEDYLVSFLSLPYLIADALHEGEELPELEIRIRDIAAL